VIRIIAKGREIKYIEREVNNRGVIIVIADVILRAKNVQCMTKILVKKSMFYPVTIPLGSAFFLVIRDLSES